MLFEVKMHFELQKSSDFRKVRCEMICDVCDILTQGDGLIFLFVLTHPPRFDVFVVHYLRIIYVCGGLDSFYG